MSPFRRKAVENALVAELRELGGSAPSMKAIRDQVAARLGGALLLPELAGAVQSLRYQGKLGWDAIELSESMMTEQHIAASAEAAVEDGTAGSSEVSSPPPSAEGPESAPLSGPDDEEDYPGEVNDQAEQGPRPRPLPAIAPERATASSGSFVPKRLLQKAGVHAASTRAGSRALPVPKHESEVERAVREEVEDLRDRRRCARSTATVRQPLELRKFGVRDMDLAEGVSSLLAEQPNDLMAAISRKHPQLWKRVLQLGRATDRRPAEALYAALEAGLDEMEAALPQQRADAA